MRKGILQDYISIRTEYGARWAAVAIAEQIMATNTGRGFRRGSVYNRTQFLNPQTGLWTKRDTENGRIMDQKANGKPFRGVAQEPDRRR